MTQSEQQLENNLIRQLEGFGFENVGGKVADIKGLEKNLKTQLEKLNSQSLENKPFSQREFSAVLNELNKGGIFEKSKLLREPNINISFDDGESRRIKLFDRVNLEKNIFQVTNQITVNGKYENRYDVTILVNGLPLVQIELKRRGVEMKEAFNQIGRYQKHSFTGTLFEFVQVFIISNGDEVKYFANNLSQSYEQTFFWTDERNKKISDLSDFAEVFLNKEFLSKYISEYIVLAESGKIPMVLRPYQYYAVKAIEERVKNTDKGGYIWHTTGSGKTLTSFKASQVLVDMGVKKVLFVVDRKDLDIQTTVEFNSFSKDSVDGSENTSSLVRQLADPNKKLVVTTIQKLDRALTRENYLQKFKDLENENIVIIFDECHRGQFGETNRRIKDFFKKAQIFGFTGTPIFADNANNGMTTKDIFGEALHKYIITDAISDGNVLGFSVEYVGRYRNKNDFTVERDIEVEDINTKEVLESDERMEKITKFILEDWKRKTKRGKFNAILAVSSVEMLKKYYLAFEKLKNDGFKVATIFSYQANEEDKDDGSLDVEEVVNIENQHSRDFLEKCIADYNKDFSTNFSTQNFEGYRQNLQKRIKGEKKGYLKREDKRIDLVIVVNMLLTGFDAKKLNTLYVDKNLKYHGLIQAFSRTNRLLNSDKPHGNVVIFRNLKKFADEALALYGNPEANQVVFKKPYKMQVAEFNEILKKMREIAPKHTSIDDFKSEEEKVRFIKIFRELLRKKASLETFSEFSFDNLNIFAQEFENYKGKYFELYENNKKNVEKEKESILDDIDFELELVVKDEINYDYIILLLTKIINDGNKSEDIKKALEQIKNNLKLKSKRELIEKFIKDNLPQLDKNADVKVEFERFLEKEKELYLEDIIEENNLDAERFNGIIMEYLETDKIARNEEILETFYEDSRPSFLEEYTVVSKIKSHIFNFAEKFRW